MQEHPRSALFLIRLWSDNEPGAGWQGRIQPIGEGRAATFSDWPTLQQLLQEMMLVPQEDNKPDHNNQDAHPPLDFPPSPFQ
jgi:hypothetical protein